MMMFVCLRLFVVSRLRGDVFIVYTIFVCLVTPHLLDIDVYYIAIFTPTQSGGLRRRLFTIVYADIVYDY